MAKRKQVKQGGDAKKAQKVVRKDEDEDEEEVDADVSSDGEASSEAESSGKEEENDGLADMMSKILNQNTGSKV